MTIWLTFWRDRRGALREMTTAVAAVVTLIGVGSAIGLDRLTRDGSLPRIAIIMPDHEFAKRLPAAEDGQTRVDPGTLDRSSVASIPDRLHPVRLDPCTGVSK
jgi:hypothetical protein